MFTTYTIIFVHVGLKFQEMTNIQDQPTQNQTNMEVVQPSQDSICNMINNNYALLPTVA